MGSKAARHSVQALVLTYQGRWPAATTQGVFLRSTEARSFFNQASWEPLGANGPAFSAPSPLGSSGAFGKSVSVLNMTKWTMPWSNEYQKFSTPPDEAEGMLNRER